MAATTATGAGAPSTATEAGTRIAPAMKPAGATQRSITAAATGRTTGRTIRTAAGSSVSPSRAESGQPARLRDRRRAGTQGGSYEKEPAWISANSVNG